MNVHNLGAQNSLVNNLVAELRDVNIQQNAAKFRANLKRLGQIFAYEISKQLEYKSAEVETPMGIAEMSIGQSSIVLVPILRAGVPFNEGLLDMFNQAETGFISAYRHHQKSGAFNIKIEYVSSPSLDGKILILVDPMIATGSSINFSLEALAEFGTPDKIIVAGVIASTYGLEQVKRKNAQTEVFVAAIDEELTARSYIVPGLGDAGDLSYGKKLRD